MSFPPIPDALSPLAAFIRRSASPCIAISSIPDGECALGGSKIGGTAALPEAFQWPLHSGKRLDFLLQLNLAELANGVAFGLPADGLLSFFYDLEDCPWVPEIGGAYRVVYTPGNAAAAQLRPSGDTNRLTEAPLSFRAGLSLPYFGTTALGDFQQLIRTAIGHVPSDDEVNDF